MATQNSGEASFSTESTPFNAFDSESSSFPENEAIFEQQQQRLDADNMDSDPTATQKKKKKKKPKKSAAAKAKDAAAKKATETAEAEGRPPVLCISRNKHWRYISSYHVRLSLILSRFFSQSDIQGPWLQLPIELLESLLILNMDPATLSVPENPQTYNHIRPSNTSTPRLRDRGFEKPQI